MIISFAKTIWAQLRRDPALITLLVLAFGYFIIYYVTDPLRPAGIFGHHDQAQYALGWFGYYDQGQYLRMAHTLASLHLSGLHQTYSYGLGYPLVAVPALWLGFNSDPFVFFDLAAFLFAAFAIYRVASHIISRPAGLLAGFGLIFATPLIHYVEQPWNSTVCLVVMSTILLTLTLKKIKTWHVLVIGLMLGWAFAARYVDIVWLGPLSLACLYRQSLKTLARQLIPIAIGASLVILPVLYSQYRVFGSPFRTPYVNHLGLGGAGGSDQSLGAYDLHRAPVAALALFVSPRLAGSHDADRGLLIDMFWAVLFIPGFFVLYRLRPAYRPFIISFTGLGLIASLFYLSFRASTPGSLKYGELHYFKMFWPGVVLFAVAVLDALMHKSTDLHPPAKRSLSK